MSRLIQLLSLILVSVTMTDHAEAEDLGRLFTTPEQRLKLDTLRYTRMAPEPVQPTVVSREEEPETTRELFDKTVNFKGYVSKQGGDSTAWLNDTNTLKGDLSLGSLEIKSIDKKTGKITIVVPGRDSAVPLKVGESYEPFRSGEE